MVQKNKIPLILSYCPVLRQVLAHNNVISFFKNINIFLSFSKHKDSYGALSLPSLPSFNYIARFSNTASDVKTKLILFSQFKNFLLPLENKKTNIFAVFINKEKNDLHNTIHFFLELFFHNSSIVFLPAFLLKIMLVEFTTFKGDIQTKNLIWKSKSQIVQGSRHFRILSYLSKYDFFIVPELIKKIKERERRKMRKDRKIRLEKKKMKLEAKQKRLADIKKKSRHFRNIPKHRFYKKRYNSNNRYSNKKLPHKTKVIIKTKSVFRREELECSKFYSKLIAVSMKCGMKKRAIRIINNSLIAAKRQLKMRISNKKIIKRIYKAINPVFALKKFNFGRRSVLIPSPLRREKRAGASARLFINAVNGRSGISFSEKLTEEITDFFLKNKKPFSIKARDQKIRTAFDNKSNLRFLRFRKKK